MFWQFLSVSVIPWVLPVADALPMMKNAFGNRNYYINFG